MNSQSPLEKFVIGDPKLGIGRLVGLDNYSARIRYFRGPVTQPYVELQWDRRQLVAVEPALHTRVYYHDGNRWRIGRIDAEHPDRDGRFVVALPRKEGQILTSDQFDIRWSVPIEDPYEILASLGGDSPIVYEPRVDLIDSWHRLRTVSTGANGLLLGSVELHNHQLTVVRTVTNDRDRRYLLADEVGLGKTVEASALIWQELSNNPGSEVLVLTPDHLCPQWTLELRNKFHIHSNAVNVRAHEYPDTWPDSPIQVLVVDEAHHLTRAGPYASEVVARVTQLAHGATAVFLLSATPVRSHEAAFLDLLHILDPQNYHPQDTEAFTRRVEMRDKLALIYHSLTPDLDEFDFSLYAEPLQAEFPDDPSLALLVEQALECLDHQRPERIANVREHLSATYRLHHRLLRTRRTPQINETFGVRGRRRGIPFTIEIKDESDEIRVDLIESFRQHLAELVESGLEIQKATKALRLLGQACGSLPQAVLDLTASPTSQEASELLYRWLMSKGDAWRRDLEATASIVLDATIERIGVMAISKDLGKVVVASVHPTVAQSVATALAVRFGEHRVANHLVDRSRVENSASVDRWRLDVNCRVLVCDSSAEEGVNLQDADAIIHLDLPWDGFRLEQRIGRVDRFARGQTEAVKSMVLVYGEQEYASGWFVFAADSCGIFDRSASSLQYVLFDMESEVLSRVITRGVNLFYQDVKARRDSLESEAERIAAHDSLDSVAGHHDGLNDRLLREDDDPQLGQALKTWLIGVNAKLWFPALGSFQIERSGRLQVPFTLERAMAPWIGSELALSREVALKRRVPLVRPGHGLLDAIVDHLKNDDRGVAFAFMRRAKGCWPPRPMFRTDFLVRAVATGKLEGIAMRHGMGSWLRVEFEAQFAPQLETVYMADDGTELHDSQMVKPYNDSRGDRNLIPQPELFDKLTSHLDWNGICAQGLDRARQVLMARDSVVPRSIGAADSLRSLVNNEITKLQARGTAGLEPVHERIQELKELGSAVPEQLELAIDVIGCGAIIYADPNQIER